MSGVSWDSVSATAAFAAITGTWDGNYPVANLGDLRRISKIARVTPVSGAVSFSLAFPANTTAGIVALVNHTIPSGNIRFRLYSSAILTGLVHDSGTIAVWPSGGPAPNLAAIRPYIPSSPITVRSMQIDLTGLPAGAIDLGGLEVAKYWDWPGLGPGKQFGFDNRTAEVQFLGAGADPPPGGAPRVMNGEIPFLALATAATTGLDFQATQGKAKPFVYVQDYVDPASWARTCMLCTNVEVPPSVGALYRHDTFQFRFREHLR